jgi:hypothetical protein
MNGRVIAGGATALVLLLLAAWNQGWFEREDPLVAEMKQMIETPPSEDQRQEMRQVMEQRTEGMTDEQKMEFFFNTIAPVMMPMMMRQMEERYDKFMAMTPEERRRELDKQIDQMRNMQRGGPPRGFGGGPQGQGGGPPQIAPERMDAMRKKMLDWITPDQRAKFENGMKMMADRMKERGMEPIGPPGGGGGFF